MSVDKDEQDIEYIQLQIVSFLQMKKEEKEEEAVPTLEISKAVFGKGATKKMINKHLYALERAGQVEKIAEEDGTKPRWKVL